jgi:2-iminobutanoate/2-iminopropanoate deaminase
MVLETISSPDAPAAVGAYSQAVKANGFLFCSGQIPIDPSTGKLIESNLAAEQATRVLKNLEAVLKAAGTDFQRVVKATIYLADINDFKAVNDVYASYFTGPVKPARATVQVGALPLGARVEIDLIALA